MKKKQESKKQNIIMIKNDQHTQGYITSFWEQIKEKNSFIAIEDVYFRRQIVQQHSFGGIKEQYNRQTIAQYCDVSIILYNRKEKLI